MAGVVTLLTVHERDITSEVCRRCARCCQVEIKVSNTDSRYRKFLRGVGLSVSPAAVEGKDDCCELSHDITVDLGPCQHLRTQQFGGETIHECGLWGDARRPQLCEEYNCVSWAKSSNAYNLSNAMLVTAQSAWNRSQRVEAACREDVNV